MANGDALGQLRIALNFETSDFDKSITQAQQGLRLATEQFKANTAGINKANKSLDDLNTEYKSLENVLKSQVVVTQKFKDQMEKSSASARENREEANRLQDQWEEAKRTFGETSAEAMELEKKFNKANQAANRNERQAHSLEIQYNKNLAAMKNTKSQLDNVQNAMDKYGQETNQAEKETKQLGNEMTDAKKDTEKLGLELSSLSGKTDGIKNAFSKLGGALTGAFTTVTASVAATTAAIGGLVGGMQDINKDLARLKTNAANAGFSLEGAEEGFQKIAAISGETDSAVETMANLMQTDFSDQQLSAVIDEINGAAIRFSDTLKTEGIADGLQETLATGNAIGPFAELLERSGVNLDTFNEGLAKAAKNGKETDYVLQQLSDLGLKSAYDEYKKLNPELVAQQDAQMGLQMALADLAILLTPLVTMIMEFTTKIVEWASENIELLKSFDSIKDGLKILLPQLLEKGMDMIGNIISGIIQQLPNLINIAQTFIPVISSAIANMLPMILNTGASLLVNILNGMAQNIPHLIRLVQSLIPTMTATIQQLLPQIIAAGSNLLMNIVTGITQAIPSLIVLVQSIIPLITSTLSGFLPQILDAGISLLLNLLDGVVKMLPDLSNMAVVLIATIVTALMNNLPKILNSGVKIVTSLVQGISKELPNLLTMAVKLILSVSKSLINNLPQIIEAGAKILGALITGIVSMQAELGKKIITEIIPAIVDHLKDIDLKQIGKDIINGLISGITGSINKLGKKIKEIGKNIKSWLADVLDIHSPSRVMRDQIGAHLPTGIVAGIEKSMPKLKEAVTKMGLATLPSFNSGGVPGISGGSSVTNTTNITPNINIHANDPFKSALENQRMLRRIQFMQGGITR